MVPAIFQDSREAISNAVVYARYMHGRSKRERHVTADPCVGKESACVLIVSHEHAAATHQL